MDTDRLSDLPPNIIETILTLLPIRDAIKTSVLSSEWRDRWASIPQLVFTDKCVDLRGIVKGKKSLQKFITYTLFLHRGPINTFEVCSSMLQSCDEVAHWILFLSRNHVDNVTKLVLRLVHEELWIRDDWFEVPSCLFSFKKLTHLTLLGCVIEPPPSFKGFSCLRTLNLQEFFMSPQDLERLISSCPLLEDLVVYRNNLDLRIYAPNLKYLSLHGELLYQLHLENSPLLKEMCITFNNCYYDKNAQEDFEKSTSCNFLKVLGNVPHLERMYGESGFTQFLSIDLDLWKPHVTFNGLKVIKLRVSFEHVKEIMVVLKLIINCPFLQKLFIHGPRFHTNDVDSPDHQAKFMESEYPSCTFKFLKTVKMRYMCGMPLEMSLIKYLLGNSPALEKMSVTPCFDLNEVRLNMLLEFVSFCGASSPVRIKNPKYFYLD